MKKIGLWSIGIAALAVFLLAACGNGTTKAAAGDDDEPLVYQDRINGKVVEITISRTDPSRAVLTPRVNDYFEIKYGGVVISKGRITKVESNGQATFTPDADSPGPKIEFTGTFTEGSISLPNIPIEGGTLTGVDATEDGGTSPGTGTGGGGGTPSPLPPAAAAAWDLCLLHLRPSLRKRRTLNRLSYPRRWPRF